MEAHKKYPRSSFFYPMGNCEAAWQLAVASGEEPSTPFAEKGTRVHAVIANRENLENLDRAEQDLAKDLQGKGDRIQTDWMRLAPDYRGPDEVLIEQRLWLRDGLRPIFSGQPDRMIRAGKRMLILDYKSGWHPQDEISATNSQLRSYVVLGSVHWPEVEEATVGIVKPGKMSPVAVFDKQAIQEAHEWCIAVVAAAVAKREKTPHKGPWCKFCSGKVLCPLWKNEVLTFSDRVDLAVTDIPDTVLAELAPRLEMAATVIKKLQDRLWGRVQLAPENFPDWRLEPGDRRRSIEHLLPLYQEAVKNRGDLSLEEFLECSRIAIGEFESLVRSKTKLAMLEIHQRYGQFMTVKPTRSRLVYDPKPKELYAKTSETN